MKKRILAILLSAIMVLSMVACASEDTSSDDTNAEIDI